MGVDENCKGLENHAQEECSNVAGKSAGDWELVGSVELEESQMELDPVEFDWPLPGMRGVHLSRERGEYSMHCVFVI